MTLPRGRPSPGRVKPVFILVEESKDTDVYYILSEGRVLEDFQGERMKKDVGMSETNAVSPGETGPNVPETSNKSLEPPLVCDNSTTSSFDLFEVDGVDECPMFNDDVMSYIFD